MLFSFVAVRRLILSEERVEIGAHIGGVPFLGADDFAGDFAVAVHDVCFRDHGCAIGESDGGATVFGAGITVIGEGYGLVDDELGEGVGVFVGSYAEDKAIAGLDVFVEAVQGRCLGDAGRAPTGPEIEHDHLSAQIRQMAGLAGQVESEILCGRTGDGCFSLPIAVHGEDDDQS